MKISCHLKTSFMGMLSFYFLYNNGSLNFFHILKISKRISNVFIIIHHVMFVCEWSNCIEMLTFRLSEIRNMRSFLMLPSLWSPCNKNDFFCEKEKIKGEKREWRILIIPKIGINKTSFISVAYTCMSSTSITFTNTSRAEFYDSLSQQHFEGKSLSLGST